MSFASLERLGLMRMSCARNFGADLQINIYRYFLDDVSIIASCYDARFFLENPYARIKIISQ